MDVYKKLKEVIDIFHIYETNIRFSNKVLTLLIAMMDDE